MAEYMGSVKSESQASAAVRGTLKRKVKSISKGAELMPDERNTHGSKASRVETELTVRPESACIHDVALPSGFVGDVEDIRNPKYYRGELAKKFKFDLDAFQACAVTCIERGESVLVSAHTSAGKTAVAEYAVATSFRDGQRIVYTSPLKALSNQKFRELKEEFGDVGLLTGDVSIDPGATCVVMTTEILRMMLYRGDELLQSVRWVVFDEVHYMRDRDRGVIWEETIIFSPPGVGMVFLSATLPNATEFAGWVAHTRKQACHVVYTEHRPVPLEHYVFPPGGSEMHMVVDGGGRFNRANFEKVQSEAKVENEKKGKSEQNGSKKGEDSQERTSKDGSRWRGEQQSQREGTSTKQQSELKSSKERRKGLPQSSVKNVIKGAKENELYPVIIFSFSRRECEAFAVNCQELEFNTQEESEAVEEIFSNAIECLPEEDRQLSAVTSLLPLIRRGVGVHHSGLLPMLKELVEILFQEQLVKALFATETFAMGLNMPARSVIFTGLTKFDGEKMRSLTSGEYIQMAGRAGRRGKDSSGLCIVIADSSFTEEACRSMMQGDATPLESSFRLTFHTILSLFRRPERRETTEKVIRQSFHQYQHETRLPAIDRQISELEEEANSIEGPSQPDLDEHAHLVDAVSAAEKKVSALAFQVDRCVKYFEPGRLVKVTQGRKRFGWCVLVNAKRIRENAEGATDKRRNWQLDVLVPCASSQEENGRASAKLEPAGDLEEGNAEMQVVPVLLSLVVGMGTQKVMLPSSLLSMDERQGVLHKLREIVKSSGGEANVQELDKRKDIGAEGDDLTLAEERLTDLKEKLNAKEGRAIGNARSKAMKRKAELKQKAEQLRADRGRSEVERFRLELENRAAVLRRLGHLTNENALTAKGRAACELEAADELVCTELMLQGVLSQLDERQLAAVMSCFIGVEKSEDTSKLKKEEMARCWQSLREHAHSIGEVMKQCGMEIEPETYRESFKCVLIDVVCSWSGGAKFDDVAQMTDIFEGSLVKAIRRLDEILMQLSQSASALEDHELASKSERAAESLRRGIVSSSSLYL